MKKSGLKMQLWNRVAGLVLGVVKGVAIILVIALTLSWVPEASLKKSAGFIAQSRILKEVKQRNSIRGDVVLKNLNTALSLAADPEARVALKERLSQEGVDESPEARSVEKKANCPSTN